MIAHEIARVPRVQVGLVIGDVWAGIQVAKGQMYPRVRGMAPQHMLRRISYIS